MLHKMRCSSHSRPPCSQRLVMRPTGSSNPTDPPPNNQATASRAVNLALQTSQLRSNKPASSLQATLLLPSCLAALCPWKHPSMSNISHSHSMHVHTPMMQFQSPAQGRQFGKITPNSRSSSSKTPQPRPGELKALRTYTAPTLSA
jgi:hypothetical protein